MDESPLSLAAVHGARGEAGLQELPGIGGSLAAQIASLIQQGLARARSILPNRA